MTKISNFYLNTHFTALKQLPEAYKGRLSLGATTLSPLELGRTLGTTNIRVPAGIYVETILLRCGLDGNKNHLTPQFRVNLDDKAEVYISINQTANDNYELVATANNFVEESVTIPASTIEAVLRLAISPFD